MESWFRPEPTPVPTAAPTAAPATSTPLPTSTPAPKLIGVKTSTAKFVYLTNSTKGEIREIYLRAAGGEEWGKSLVPAEATIKDAEQVQMYYTPDSARDAIYDMKLVDGDGNAYEIYSVQLSDMEKAKLMIDNGEAYLTYTSLSDKSEKSTIGRSICLDRRLDHVDDHLLDLSGKNGFFSVSLRRTSYLGAKLSIEI